MGFFSSIGNTLKDAIKAPLNIATLGQADKIGEFGQTTLDAVSGSAAQKAAKQAAAGYGAASGQYDSLLPNAQSMYAPYQQASSNALNQYTKGMNQPNTPLPQYGGSEQFQFDPSQMANNPAYKFLMDQGTEAVNRSAGAKGMLGSGNRLAELTQFGQGLASQEYGNEFNRQFQTSNENQNRALQDYGLNYQRAGDTYNQGQNSLNRQQQMASTGLDINQLLTQLGLNVASGKANAAVGQGNAVASGTMGQANALNSLLQQGVGAIGFAGAPGAGQASGGFGGIFKRAFS